jgi:hypothetical protein
VIGIRSTIDLIVTTKKKAKIFDVYDSIRKPFFIETPPPKKDIDLYRYKKLFI